jgi:hypothetical protein
MYSITNEEEDRSNNVKTDLLSSDAFALAISITAQYTDIHPANLY